MSVLETDQTTEEVHEGHGGGRAETLPAIYVIYQSSPRGDGGERPVPDAASAGWPCLHDEDACSFTTLSRPSCLGWPSTRSWRIRAVLSAVLLPLFRQRERCASGPCAPPLSCVMPRTC